MMPEIIESGPIKWPDFIRPLDTPESGLLSFDLWCAEAGDSPVLDLERGTHYAQQALELSQLMNDGEGDSSLIAGILRAIVERKTLGALEIAFLGRIARAAHAGSRN